MEDDNPTPRTDELTETEALPMDTATLSAAAAPALDPATLSAAAAPALEPMYVHSHTHAQQ